MIDAVSVAGGTTPRTGRGSVGEMDRIGYVEGPKGAQVGLTCGEVFPDNEG
jgi:hypothetical protein